MLTASSGVLYQTAQLYASVKLNFSKIINLYYKKATEIDKGH